MGLNKKEIEDRLRTTLKEFGLYNHDAPIFIFIGSDGLGYHITWGQRYLDSTRFIIRGTKEGVWTINDFNIKEEFRGRGYGTKLYSLVEDFCRKTFTLTKFVLNAATEESRNFWKKQGFLERGVLDGDEGRMYEKSFH